MNPLIGFEIEISMSEPQLVAIGEKLLGDSLPVEVRAVG